MMKRLLSELSLVGVVLAFSASALGSEDPTGVLTSLVASQLAVESSHVSLTLLQAPNLDGPLSAYRFEFGSVPRGRTVVRATSATSKDVTFAIEVRLWDSAWVATSQVERGTELTGELFARSWLDVTDASIWSADRLEGVRSKRTLPPGTLLESNAVEPLPLITRGHAVTLAATSSHLKVSRQGVALTDALLGETVRVRVDSHTIISATATGPNLCVVAL
jgi:flagella basal body P-ring formation protein FlgA